MDKILISFILIKIKKEKIKVLMQWPTPEALP